MMTENNRPIADRLSEFKHYFIPVALWLYPACAFISNNLGQFQLITAIRLLVVAILLAVLLVLAGKLIFKTAFQAGIFSSLVAILFTSYGHLYLAVYNWRIGEFIIGRHRVLFLLFLLLFITGVLLIRKVRSPHARLVDYLVWFSLLLLLIPAYQVSIYAINQSARLPVEAEPPAAVPAVAATESLPDVYLFVLDAYGRADVIRERAGYDNSAFIQFLEASGFYVADCSMSNYNQTWVSIASMLNMDYREAMPALNGETRPAASMVPYIRQSRVRRELEALGYRTVAFETGFGFSEITDADLFLENNEAGVLSILTGSLNNFELEYIRTTILSAGLEMLGFSEVEMQAGIKRDRQEFVYRTLKDDIAGMPGPQFIFAHILTTHYPYVNHLDEFDGDPSLSQLTDRGRGYHDALVYSDRQMMDVITRILEEAEIPPVIIITGDHGMPTARGETMNILQAVYLGERSSRLLYPAITPVNDFRVVFNEVFGADYPLLPDKSWLAIKGDGNNLQLVENTCTSPGQ